MGRIHRGITAILLTCLGAQPVASAWTYKGLIAAPTTVTGDRPRSVAVGDFNGDGFLDVAVANTGGSSMTVALGCASTTKGCVNGYLPAKNYSLPNASKTPTSIVTADVNGDGKLDIIVSDGGNNSVSLLFGNGNGTFTATAACGTVSTCAVGLDPTFVAVGNFTGKPKEVDIVVANSAANSISVMLGNGTNFNPAVTYSVGTNPVAIAVADFNGDGFQDIAVANGEDSTISVLVNNQLGGFTVASTAAAGTTPVSVVAADFTGDHVMDLAVANASSNNVSILVGNGNGTFQTAVNFNVGAYPQSVAAGDFNGDNNQDLAVANAGSDSVSILLGHGNGNFEPATNFSSGPKPAFVAVADTNNDLKQDVLVINRTDLPGGLTVLLGNGNGTFSAGVGSTLGTTPLSVATGDFNCDSKQDFAAANSASNSVSLLLGKGDGTFQIPSTLNTDVNPVYIVAADFNKDGKTDLAVLNFASDDVSILMNANCAGFSPAVNYSLGANVQATTIAVGDFNGDGYPDLAVANIGSGNAGNVIILMNNQDGTFGSPSTFLAGTNPDAVAVGDFNGDHKQDLAVANQGSNNVSILLGNGDGTFSLSSSYCTGFVPCKGGVPTSVATADFNGDGFLDLAVTNYNDQSVSIFLGNGNGTFGAETEYTVFPAPIFITAAAIQGNATQQDLLVANSMGYSVSVVLNSLNGTGSFVPNKVRPFDPGMGPVSLATADFNGDGLLDLVVVDEGGNDAVTVLQKK